MKDQNLKSEAATDGTVKVTNEALYIGMRVETCITALTNKTRTGIITGFKPNGLTMLVKFEGKTKSSSIAIGWITRILD
jgi:hypothetical protein